MYTCGTCFKQFESPEKETECLVCKKERVKTEEYRKLAERKLMSGTGKSGSQSGKDKDAKS